MAHNKTPVQLINCPFIAAWSRDNEAIRNATTIFSGNIVCVLARVYCECRRNRESLCVLCVTFSPIVCVQVCGDDYYCFLWILLLFPTDLARSVLRCVVQSIGGLRFSVPLPLTAEHITAAANTRAHTPSAY